MTTPVPNHPDFGPTLWRHTRRHPLGGDLAVASAVWLGGCLLVWSQRGAPGPLVVALCLALGMGLVAWSAHACKRPHRLRFSHRGLEVSGRWGAWRSVLDARASIGPRPSRRSLSVGEVLLVGLVVPLLWCAGGAGFLIPAGLVLASGQARHVAWWAQVGEGPQALWVDLAAFPAPEELARDLGAAWSFVSPPQELIDTR